MGLRGPNARPKSRQGNPKATARKRAPKWQAKGLSRAERVIAFIESLRVTSGIHTGRRFRLRDWQRAIIAEWYATDRKGRRTVRTGLLSVAQFLSESGE